MKAGRRAARVEVEVEIEADCDCVLECDCGWACDCDCDCEGRRACFVCDRVCTLVVGVDTLCVVVLADEAEESAGLGFALEGAWDSGRSVVAAVRDVTVDLALEWPR